MLIRQKTGKTTPRSRNIVNGRGLWFLSIGYLAFGFLGFALIQLFIQSFFVILFEAYSSYAVLFFSPQCQIWLYSCHQRRVCLVVLSSGLIHTCFLVITHLLSLNSSTLSVPIPLQSPQSIARSMLYVSVVSLLIHLSVQPSIRQTVVLWICWLAQELFVFSLTYSALVAPLAVLTKPPYHLCLFLSPSPFN